MQSNVIPTTAGKTFQVIYYPLDKVIEHSDTAKGFYNWYYRLWCDPLRDSDPFPQFATRKQ